MAKSQLGWDLRCLDQACAETATKQNSFGCGSQRSFGVEVKSTESTNGLEKGLQSIA